MKPGGREPFVSAATVRRWAAQGSGFPLATRRTTAISIGAANILAAVAVLIALATPQFAGATATGLISCCVISLVAGAYCLWALDAVPPLLFQAMALLGTIQISLLVLNSGGGTPAVVMGTFFLWVPTISFLLYDWRLAAFQTAVAAVTCLFIMSATPGAGPGVAVILTSVVLGVAGLVGFLVYTASRADTDLLTGLPTRRTMVAQLQSALSRSFADGDPGCYVVVDLDHFKQVNDDIGHAAGDGILRQIATQWRAGLPDRFTLARMGGDEFGVLMPGTGLRDALHFVEEMRYAFTPGVTGSAGIAELRLDDSIATVSARADAALFRAKRSGRNRTVVDQPAQFDPARLPVALAAGEVHLYCQRIIDLRTGRTTGVECLSRWQHPDHGLIYPDEFIPLAESTGTIVPLGRWVMTEAFHQFARSPDQRLMVNVNVSVVELEQAGFADGVLGLLAAAGMSPRRLVLEITEGALDLGSPTSIDALTRLRNHGVKVAIDDFGTGYSALARLDSVPVDLIKLDKSFLAKVGVDGNAPPLMVAVLAIAAALGLPVIAEGVETEDQERVLLRLSCVQAQGFRYGRPTPLHPDV